MDLKGEMEAGDLTVFRTTEGSPEYDTRVKLRTCTVRKSARNRRSREFYFDFWGNIVTYNIFSICDIFTGTTDFFLLLFEKVITTTLLIHSLKNENRD